MGGQCCDSWILMTRLANPKAVKKINKLDSLKKDGLCPSSHLDQ